MQNNSASRGAALEPLFTGLRERENKFLLRRREPSNNLPPWGGRPHHYRIPVEASGKGLPVAVTAASTPKLSLPPHTDARIHLLLWVVSFWVFFKQSLEQMLWDRKTRHCALILWSFYHWRNAALVNHHTPEVWNNEDHVVPNGKPLHPTVLYKSLLQVLLADYISNEWSCRKYVKMI